MLFDEIEKAHPDVFNILLQILEDGRLTDSQGRVADFRNTVIIMTSNVGARLITDHKRVGFNVAGDERNYENMKSDVLGELKKEFRPEFLNRVDEIIVFHPLTEDNLKDIVGIMLKSLAERVAENEIHIEVSDAVKLYIVQRGHDNIFGARPLRRTIQSMIEDKLAEKMLEGKVKQGDKVAIDVKDNEITFSVVNKVPVKKA
mgnify:CR=1 FL=1